MPELLQKKIDAKLLLLKEQALIRRRLLVDEISQNQGSNIAIAGKDYINFASNDYLGLANQTFMADALKAATDTHGVGSGASPLVTATMISTINLSKSFVT